MLSNSMETPQVMSDLPFNHSFFSDLLDCGRPVPLMDFHPPTPAVPVSSLPPLASTPANPAVVASGAPVAHPATNLSSSAHAPHHLFPPNNSANNPLPLPPALSPHLPHHAFTHLPHPLQQHPPSHPHHLAPIHPIHHPHLPLPHPTHQHQLQHQHQHHLQNHLQHQHPQQHQHLQQHQQPQQHQHLTAKLQLPLDLDATPVPNTSAPLPPSNIVNPTTQALPLNHFNSLPQTAALPAISPPTLSVSLTPSVSASTRTPTTLASSASSASSLSSASTPSQSEPPLIPPPFYKLQVHSSLNSTTALSQTRPRNHSLDVNNLTSSPINFDRPHDHVDNNSSNLNSHLGINNNQNIPLSTPHSTEFVYIPKLGPNDETEGSSVGDECDPMDNELCKPPPPPFLPAFKTDKAHPDNAWNRAFQQLVVEKTLILTKKPRSTPQFKYGSFAHRDTKWQRAFDSLVDEKIALLTSKATIARKAVTKSVSS